VLDDYVNRIITGDCCEVMRQLPDNSIDLVVTSPPYWALRDYGEETARVWGGEPECEHDFELRKVPSRGNRDISFNERWGNSPGQRKVEKKNKIDASVGFCSKCGAWKGQLGLEPHPEMYIQHLTEICREIKRILKPSGSFWLNLGDTYFGGGGTYGKPKDWKDLHTNQNYPDGSFFKNRNKLRSNWLQPKQLLGIPWRVAIALQEDGWILRNCLVWYKPNHLPESVKDRLTKSYEFFFFFVKKRKYFFDLDAIRVPYKQSTLKRERYGYKTAMRGRYMGPWEKRDRVKDQEFLNPLGKNPGDVWAIPVQPFHDAHFAVFPPQLIEPIIKAGCPVGGIVLDPFAGTGTTLRVARGLGRHFIGIELNPKYVKMAHARVKASKYVNRPDGVASLTEILNGEGAESSKKP